MVGSFCPIKPQLFASEQSEEVHRAKVAGSATTTTREEKDPPPFSMKTPLHLNEREEATDFFSWPNSFLFFFLLTVSWNCTLPLHSTPPPLFFFILPSFLWPKYRIISLLPLFLSLPSSLFFFAQTLDPSSLPPLSPVRNLSSPFCFSLLPLHLLKADTSPLPLLRSLSQGGR